MDALGELVGYYRELLAVMREDIIALETGRWRLFEGPNLERDISIEMIAKKKQIANGLEHLIELYERSYMRGA